MVQHQYSIPEAAPFLAVPLATAGLVYRDVADYLRRVDEDTLAYIAGHILMHDFELVWATNCLEAELGLSPLEWTRSPSWWITDVLPALKSEYQRRHRPQRDYGADSLLAQLKALDLATVAGRYTELRRAGPGKLKGRCPMHDEKTPSFYVFEDSQRWHCFGACARGGDVINLLAAMRRRKVTADV